MHGVCGNSVVEGWEECDCGSDPKLCQALCCVPNTGQPDGRTPCTRTSSAACSPSEGVCCTSNCSFAEVDVECKAATDCSAASTCSALFQRTLEGCIVYVNSHWRIIVMLPECWLTCRYGFRAVMLNSLSREHPRKLNHINRPNCIVGSISD